MKTLIMISGVMIFSSLAMDNDKITRSLSKMDAVSAIFIRDCEKLHFPLTYDQSLIVIKNNYLRIYEAKKRNSRVDIPETSPKSS
jgi:hypothetical protein